MTTFTINVTAEQLYLIHKTMDNARDYLEDMAADAEEKDLFDTVEACELELGEIIAFDTYLSRQFPLFSYFGQFAKDVGIPN